jgi:hypothetical protein
LETKKLFNFNHLAINRTWGKTPGNDLCIVSSRSRISLNLKS